MKRFLKENVNQILVVILIGLVFILWARILVGEFTATAATTGLFTTKDRLRCAEYYGWDVDPTSETEETVYIPQVFDAVYERYNQLQKMSGFDLTLFSGKGVKRYTYRVLNFPGAPDAEAFLNLLVDEGKLIGGDCMTVALDGYMLPLDRRFSGKSAMLTSPEESFIMLPSGRRTTRFASASMSKAVASPACCPDKMLIFCPKRQEAALYSSRYTFCSSCS